VTFDRAALVEAARNSIARGSKSFGMASLLFDKATRERAWLLYAWCRACDDLADGQELGHGMRAVDDPAERLATIRTRTAAALRGEPTGDPAFDGFAVVAAECGITQDLAEDLIAGFALDAAGWRPNTEADLLRYCYHVAGVVGVMMALVMGVRPDDAPTLERACDLGLAFQLGNIARDIGEDAVAGRCYLPTDWLSGEGVSPDAVMAAENRPALTRLAQRLGALAAEHEARARAGTAALPFRAAWAVLAAAGIYGGIARAVVRRGGTAWDRRVSTSASQKIGWVLRALVQTTVRTRYPRPA
jgi:15-cis-phytoene synthase